MVPGHEVKHAALAIGNNVVEFLLVKGFVGKKPLEEPIIVRNLFPFAAHIAKEFEKLLHFKVPVMQRGLNKEVELTKFFFVQYKKKSGQFRTKSAQKIRFFSIKKLRNKANIRI